MFGSLFFSEEYRTTMVHIYGHTCFLMVLDHLPELGARLVLINGTDQQHTVVVYIFKKKVKAFLKMRGIDKNKIVRSMINLNGWMFGLYFLL